jgi:hypothetical protein
MLVVKYPNIYPFYSASELEDLKFPSGTIQWVKEEDRLIEAHISSVGYSLGDEIHKKASSEAWHGTSLLWSSLQRIIRQFNEIHGLASVRLTNGHFKVTGGGLVDSPCLKPHAYSLLIGDLNRSVYGKLPKQWGEFPSLTVGTASNVIKGKVDEYLASQENLDKILAEVS